VANQTFSTIHTATITTTDVRPVFVVATKWFNVIPPSQTCFRLLRDGVFLNADVCDTEETGATFPDQDRTVPIAWTDTPPAGMHTYSLQMASNGSPLLFDGTLLLFQP
jgi:hypothetical protein